jgi:predicted O-methyltransferase YrrM
MSADIRATARALMVVARDPAEALDRVRSKIEHSSDRRRQESEVSYQTSPEFERRLHERLGVPFPRHATAEFERTWNALGEALADRNSFVGDWAHDADESLARIVWCLVGHLRPQRVVETGVARGITSRIVLEGLERNGDGHLWSIDLPLLRSHWHDQTAAAVPLSLRPRWTYVRGSSRRRLPGLLAELGEIDLFVHDSAHTHANMAFEFETAWDALRPGGVLVSHDIAANAAFSDFTAAVSGEALLAQYSGDAGLVGIVFKN